MSQKFVMLFLVSKTQTVTLDAAAKILIEESQDSSSHSKYKSKRARRNTSCYTNHRFHSGINTSIHFCVFS